MLVCTEAQAAMAEDKSNRGSGEPPGGQGKHPYAMLDLKATEIKVTAIPERVQSAARSAAAAAAQAASQFGPSEVPRPAPAGSYAQTQEIPATAPVTAKTNSGVKMQDAANKPDPSVWAEDSSAKRTSTPDVRIEKRGGFFSHLAAGTVGGALALAAIVWLLPRLGIDDFAPRIQGDTSALAARLTALENSGSRSERSPDVGDIDKRLAALETTAKTIPSLTESQKRLVAETKAALASSASNKGGSDLIIRLTKVEEKMKALTEAGANDPNAGRVEQLAALTGKVSDLETALGTQLTELRKSVAQDVEGRLQSATQASEAARAGTQRIDRDVASIKNDTMRLDESIKSAHETSNKTAADLKSSRDETAQVKSVLEAIKTSTAKPADITSAVAPLSEKLAALDRSVQDIVKAEDARKATAESVVLALELQNLKRVLDSGQQYGAQLEEVKKAGGGKIDLTALSKMQNSGVPSRADLIKDFDKTANKAIDADAVQGDDSVIDKLWEGAKSVVKVRRIDAKADDKSTEATIGRMQVALNDGRLTDVMEQSKGLSPKAQDAARPFLDKVAARVSVDTALADLEKQLKTSIAAPPAANPASGKPQP